MNKASTLDKHLGKNKPRKGIRKGRKEKPGKAIGKKPKAEQKSNPPEKVSKLEEWCDIVSEKARLVDISKLGKDEVEHVLRLFDFNSEYGPFTGITRLSRWERAEEWGLEPPKIIKEIIESELAVESRAEGSLF
eukprot:GFKZ01006897.1.p1 GENE.GFKZ01006897.1~~GFKZ01006897.1.p1  ORF type:complete len:134 (-),score=22.97 GFKZ01006897.1:1024-1425(-)